MEKDQAGKGKWEMGQERTGKGVRNPNGKREMGNGTRMHGKRGKGPKSDPKRGGGHAQANGPPREKWIAQDKRT